MGEYEKDRKGDCNCCGTKYIKERWERDENPFASGHVLQKCPECGYDPLIDKNIKEILGKNIRIELRPSHYEQGLRITSNSDELSDLVLKEIIEKWPKPKKSSGIRKRIEESIEGK